MSKMMPDPVGNWNRLGRPGWPPHEVKARVVLEMAEKYSLRTLVETGTYAGDMIMSVAHCFDKVYSIEINADMYRENSERFSGLNNLELICNDSPDVLRRRTDEFLANGPALFWLDAHGPADSVLTKEIDVLGSKDIGDSIILADDVRLMSWMRDKWPDIDDVVRLIRKTWSGRSVEVKDDMILVTP
jgi:hypothetical protein